MAGTMKSYRGSQNINTTGNFIWISVMSATFKKKLRGEAGRLAPPIAIVR